MSRRALIPPLSQVLAPPSGPKAKVGLAFMPSSGILLQVQNEMWKCGRTWDFYWKLHGREPDSLFWLWNPQEIHYSCLVLPEPKHKANLKDDSVPIAHSRGTFSSNWQPCHPILWGWNIKKKKKTRSLKSNTVQTWDQWTAGKPVLNLFSKIPF